MAKRTDPSRCWGCAHARVGRCVRHRTPEQQREHERIEAKRETAKLAAMVRRAVQDLGLLISLEAVFTVLRTQYPLKTDDWVREYVVRSRRTARWRRLQNVVAYLMARNPARRIVE